MEITGNMPPISAVICTLNEEHNIAACIASVQGVDEVVVAEAVTGVRALKDNAASMNRDLKSIVFPILTHIIELGGGGIIFLLAAKALGILVF